MCRSELDLAGVYVCSVVEVRAGVGCCYHGSVAGDSSMQCPRALGICVNGEREGKRKGYGVFSCFELRLYTYW